MRSEDEAKSLQREINRWKWGVASAAVLALLAYAVWFGWFRWFGWLEAMPVGEDAGKWGTFGDFVGGLMNPLVAFAAFYWLTRSVQLQKRELVETCSALEESSEAQKQQAEQSRVAIRLDALVAANSLVVPKIAALETTQRGLERIASGGGLSEVELGNYQSRIAAVYGRAQGLREQSDKYRGEIQAILERYPLPDPTARSEDAAAPPVAPH